MFVNKEMDKQMWYNYLIKYYIVGKRNELGFFFYIYVYYYGQILKIMLNLKKIKSQCDIFYINKIYI